MRCAFLLLILTGAVLPAPLNARSVPPVLDTLVRYLRVEINDRPQYYCVEYTVERQRPAFPRQLLTFEATPGAMPLPAGFQGIIAESFFTFWGGNTKVLERDTLTTADFNGRIEQRDYNADGRVDLAFKSWASGNNANYHIFLDQLDHWMYWPRAPQPLLRVEEDSRTLYMGHSPSANEFYEAVYRVSGDTILTLLRETEVARHADGRLIRTQRERVGRSWVTEVDSSYTPGR